MKLHSKTCCKCKKSFQTKHLKTKYCKDCKVIVRKEAFRKSYLKKKDRMSIDNDYRENYLNKQRERSKKRYLKHKDKKKSYNKKWAKENPEKVKELKRNYRLNNLEKERDRLRKYYNTNKKRILEKRKQKKKEKRLSDPLFKLKENLRSLCLKGIKSRGYKKKSKTQDILGADFETVKKHLESLFYDGMSWNNYGEWQIDHIIPIASATDENHLIGIMNYKNIQPLWKKDNISKGDMMPEHWVTSKQSS